MKNEIKSAYRVLTILSLLLVIGCSSEEISPQNSGNAKTAQINYAVDKIEIFHFHGTTQCYSCITVGNYAEETVNTYFADEVKSGKIVFAHINGELVENREKVLQYGATGPSLWLGVYDANGFHAEQNINVWYKINNKQVYMDYLKGLIEKRLVGDFS